MIDSHVLGAHYEKEKTTFSVWAPGSISVTLQLYATGSTEEADRCILEYIRMERQKDDIFTAVVNGDLHGVYYVYQLTYASGREAISADP